MNTTTEALQPVGYSQLVQHYDLKVIPHYRASFITEVGRGSKDFINQQEIVIYPKTYALDDATDMLQQLEFAVKHEGIHLEIIAEVFQKISVNAVANFIKQKATGKYRRIIWFFYEYLTNKKLGLDDCKNVPYVDLLDHKKYYTALPEKNKRHAVNNNLLGDHEFCPFVRKTDNLKQYQEKNLSEKTNALIKDINADVLARTINFLYTKETKSSFGIEKVKPDIKRTIKFIALLEEAHAIHHLSKKQLVVLQNVIVEDAYKDSDYRELQNYVGELTRYYTQKIHYISPKPEDVSALMNGFLNCEEKLFSAQVYPVIIAAILSYAFVFIHPFEDGNGRIHRFIIHYVLSKTKFTPDNIIFPVSSVMLKNMRQYDEVLETFSRPLLQTIEDYDLNDEGKMQVLSDTANHYRYLDYTRFAEYLFACIEKTIAQDVPEELDFIVKYDRTKEAIQDIIDMPDIKIDRIIRCIAENHGILGKKMRKTQFSELNDETIHLIEQVVQTQFL